MFSINRHSLNKFALTFKQISYAGIASYSVGFIYGKINNLSAGKIAITAAMWHIVENMLLNFAEYYNKDKIWQKLNRASIIILSTTLGVHQFWKFGMLGKKMMMLIVLFKGTVVYGIVQEVTQLKSNLGSKILEQRRI